MTTPLFLFLQEVLMFFGGVSLLVKEIFRDLFRKGNSWSLIVEQIYQIGQRSLPLVLVTAIATGAVMTLQYGLGLERFGGKLYVPRLITVSILREMGPVFCGLMVAARVSAGIASEVASMVVTQQIDAIRALGTSPIQKIVIPRVIGCFIALPVLVAVANLACWGAGMLIGATELNLDPGFFFVKSFTDMGIADYLSGFGKSFFFSLFITIPSCYFGLNVQDGTKGVGIFTTKAVVVSSILILVGDFFITKLFWLLERV